MAKKGEHLSDITKLKISEANIGNTVWKGRKHKESSKNKISTANKGRLFTEEHRKKLSQAHKGKSTWNKGKKGIYSDETRKNMSINGSRARLGHITSELTKEKIRSKLIGRKYGPMPEEHKEKIREALTGKPCPHPNRKSTKGIPTHRVPPCAFKKGLIPWNYVDGRSTRPDLKQRYGIDWPKIRKQALERDNYICQKCGADNVLFEVHHIISYMLTHDNSLDNLVTLCKKCHREIEAMEMKLMKSKEVA